MSARSTWRSFGVVRHGRRVLFLIAQLVQLPRCRECVRIEASGAQIAAVDAKRKHTFQRGVACSIAQHGIVTVAATVTVIVTVADGSCSEMIGSRSELMGSRSELKEPPMARTLNMT